MRKLLLTTAFFSITIIYPQLSTAQEQTVIMHVSGMTCGICPISVRHRALQMAGVHSATVDIDTASATVIYEDSQQSPDAIAQAITKLGYPAVIKDTKNNE